MFKSLKSIEYAVKNKNEAKNIGNTFYEACLYNAL